MPKQTRSSGPGSRINPLARPEVPAFNCVSCLEEVKARPVKVFDDSMCEECFKDGIVPMFHLALRNEVDFPVKYGGQAVPIENYAEHFDRSFLLSWREKAAERRFLPADRLYCAGTLILGGRCNKFLGDRHRHRSTQRCTDCNSPTCADCDEQIIAFPHSCPERDTNDGDPLAGATRGTDYQLCPSCGTAVTLRDGCNHMTCAVSSCNADFCYLCGQLARPGPFAQPHWNVAGGCPQYGPVGGPMDFVDHNQPAVPQLGWTDFELFRPMTGVATILMLGGRLATPDRLEVARTRLDNAAVELHLATMRTPEGILLQDHFLALDDLANIFHNIEMEQPTAMDRYPWLQATCDLVFQLRDNLGIYVRQHIQVDGVRVGDEYWRGLTEEVSEEVETLVRLAGHRAFRFPNLDLVLRGWRSVATSNFDALRSLPPVARLPQGELLRVDLI